METKKQNTVLLVMDMQVPIVSRIADPTTLTTNLKKAIAYARANKIPVMYVVVGFRQGTPEISPNNKGFSASKQMMANANMDEWTKVHDSVVPMPGEITITKRRVSAFAGSDLEVVLRAQGIQHMILTGIATSGVVLSTLREAADKDYRLTVISDCCADMDTEVHTVLTTKVFPRQADVVTTEEWMKV